MNQCLDFQYHFHKEKHVWLVVSTHLKNISQNGNLPQIGVKIKNIWNQHLDVHFQIVNIKTKTASLWQNSICLCSFAAIGKLHSFKDFASILAPGGQSWTDKHFSTTEPLLHQVDGTKNNGKTQIIHLFRRFYMIFTIHFGVPLFLETPK